MPVIPMHQLQERSATGLEMKYYQTGGTANEGAPLGAHRDDHYIFFLVETGVAGLMIDFEVVHFIPGTLYYVLPGQVHHKISNEMADGWYLAVDTSLLTTEQRQIFEDRLQLQKPVILDDDARERFRTVLHPLYEHYQADPSRAFYRHVLYALLQAFTGMVAAEFKCAEIHEGKQSRKVALSQAFKNQLGEYYKTIKSPSAYAERLNVSPSYLNESLKKVTGMPVSYWISQQVMLEAKRLLYYTQLSVKEIAQELGYDDTAYFFRTFRQHCGCSPLTFRAGYRE